MPNPVQSPQIVLFRQIPPQNFGPKHLSFFESESVNYQDEWNVCWKFCPRILPICNSDEKRCVFGTHSLHVSHIQPRFSRLLTKPLRSKRSGLEIIQKVPRKKEDILKSIFCIETDQHDDSKNSVPSLSDCILFVFRGRHLKPENPISPRSPGLFFPHGFPASKRS